MFSLDAKHHAIAFPRMQQVPGTRRVAVLRRDVTI